MPFLHVLAQWLSVYPEVPKEQLSAQSTPLNSTSTGMPLRNGKFWLVGHANFSSSITPIFFVLSPTAQRLCCAAAIFALPSADILRGVDATPFPTPSIPRCLTCRVIPVPEPPIELIKRILFGRMATPSAPLRASACRRRFTTSAQPGQRPRGGTVRSSGNLSRPPPPFRTDRFSSAPRKTCSAFPRRQNTELFRSRPV